jgi:hypothetical protein
LYRIAWWKQNFSAGKMKKVAKVEPDCFFVRDDIVLYCAEVTLLGKGSAQGAELCW